VIEYCTYELEAYTWIMRSKNRTAAMIVSYLVVVASFTGCGELLQRRVDVPNASGADESVDARFGLTDDAQDPSARDEEMGYGRWKAKPETTGTANPISPIRRGNWTGSP